MADAEEEPKFSPNQQRMVVVAKLAETVAHLELAADSIVHCIAVAPVHPDELTPLVELSGAVAKMRDSFKGALVKFVKEDCVPHE